MVLTWKEHLLTGIEEIDNQHKELFKNVGNLLLACNKGKGKDEINSIINYLESYVTEHFKTEEKYMNEYNYSEYLNHKSEHEEFIQSFMLLKDQFTKEGASSFFALQINQKIVNWLIIHVQETDKKMANFLQDRLN